ncbi:FHA domain-containing protein [Limnoglobus roseus]|uniref:Forkhead-associated protein n=1 Tax=Limnoglobus roseus TaxID=2598579 RepID=A0A5C1AMH2_9BACT|nr:FHA domain-containing protein [Limnoglobus roseus]QEL19785.1 forkhead-associated protein [Limnoglobus roseus]
MAQALGELVPIGGGDAVPLIREVMTVGRRKSNDICLDFSNVSGQHCEFTFKNGVWYVRDLRSQNGTKVNGERVTQRVLRPGDLLSISKHEFRIEYHLTPEAAEFIENSSEAVEDIFSQSLMEKAGLSKPKSSRDD